MESNVFTELNVEYFAPLLDEGIPSKHQETIAKYRRRATAWRVPKTAPLCYRVRRGYVLKGHAPKFGPCWQGKQDPQYWNFFDEPTNDCLAFWIPRLVVKSTTMKTFKQQMALLAELRVSNGLPEHHLSSLGSAALLAGLIMAHYNQTGARVPHGYLHARTDVVHPAQEGLRLCLMAEGGHGLDCDDWCWDSERRGDLGVFALGVEPI